MALHGRSVGQPSARPAPLPGVHRRSGSSSPPTPSVSLQRPRPDTARAANLYSRAPEAADRARRSEAHRLAVRSRPASSKRGQHGDGEERGEPSGGGLAAEKASVRSRLQAAETVREQPTPLKKPGGPAEVGADSGSESAEDSIVCPVCGRCRCEACRTPRPLPQWLLCDRTCLLSADTCVDFASCMCCVKAAAYHCAASDSGSRSADRPCSCGPAGGGCCLRWTALLLLSGLVPCLACYWPLRAAARLAQACYGRGEGCTCPESEPRHTADSVARRADRPAVPDPPRLSTRD